MPKRRRGFMYTTKLEKCFPDVCQIIWEDNQIKVKSLIDDWRDENNSNLDNITNILSYNAEKFTLNETYCEDFLIAYSCGEEEIVKAIFDELSETNLNGEQELFKAAQSLLPKIYLPNILYRSSGVMLEHLLSANDFQPNLFSVTEYKDDKISRVLDDLEKRFGKDVVKNGLF